MFCSWLLLCELSAVSVCNVQASFKITKTDLRAYLRGETLALASPQILIQAPASVSAPKLTVNTVVLDDPGADGAAWPDESSIDHIKAADIDPAHWPDSSEDLASPVVVTLEVTDWDAFELPADEDTFDILFSMELTRRERSSPDGIPSRLAGLGRRERQVSVDGATGGAR